MSGARTVRTGVALLFAAGAAVFFAPGILHDEVPVFRDLLVLVLPLRAHATEAIRSGALPLWTPDLFFGAPFLANHQSSVFYPPSAILYLAPFPAGFSLLLAFHLAVAGFGAARLFSRRLGVEPASAVFGGVVFAFGGFLTSLVPLANQLQVAVWLPWMLDAADDLLENGSRRAFAALVMFLSLALLGGAPDAFALCLLLLVAWLARGVLVSPGRSRRGLAAIGAVGLAFGICAFQVLPTVEYVLQTDRSDALPFSVVAAESLRAASFWQLVIPHAFFDGAPGFVPGGGVPLFWSLYLGVIPLIAIPAALLSPRPVLFVAGIGVVALLFALGDSMPFLPLAYDVAPGIVGLFRYPAKFFLLAHFAAALLAAQGLSVALSQPRARAVVGIVSAALAAAAVLLLALAATRPETLLETLGYGLRSDLPQETYVLLADRVTGQLHRLLGLVLVLLAVLWFRTRERIGTTAAAAVLVGVTIVDLVSLHQPPLVFTSWSAIAESARGSAADLEPGVRLFHYCTDAYGCLPEGAPGLGAWGGTVRVAENVERRALELSRALVPDLPMVFGLTAVAGNDGFATRDRKAFYDVLAGLPRERAVRLLGSLGVRRLIGPDPLEAPGLHPLGTEATALSAYDVVEHAPRAYLAERVVGAADVATALTVLSAGDFRPGRDAVVEGRTDAATVRGDGTLGPVRFDRNRFETSVSTATRSLLVVSDSWFPGWTARVDGEETEIVRTNGILRGVWVPPGEHRVEMSYEPASFRAGLLLTALSGAALLFGLTVGTGSRARA